MLFLFFVFFKQKTAYEMRISDWSSDVCSSDLITPIALTLAWSIGRLPSHRREPLVLGALMGAYLVPVFLFWLTSEPLGAFTFGEFSLTLIFGNMLLPLRFRHAVAFTCSAFAITVVAILDRKSTRLTFSH